MIDRRRFLQVLGLVTGGIFFKIGLNGSKNGEGDGIFLTNCYVAGSYYYEGFKQFNDDREFPKEVLLRREPDNPYDTLAIAVLTSDREMIGYVPRRKNEVIARLMDAGKTLRADVTSRTIDELSADIMIKITQVGA